MPKVLTFAAIERYRPTGQRREIRDGGTQGLSLVIQPSGAKSWAMRFRRPNGQPAKLTLGTVDLSGKELKDKPEIGMPLSLPAARQLAAEVHRQRAMGRDVIADHAAARHRRRTEVKKARQIRSVFWLRNSSRSTRDRKRGVGGTRPGFWACAIRKMAESRRDRGRAVAAMGRSTRARIDAHDVWSVVDETRRIGAPGLDRRSNRPTDSHARVIRLASQRCLAGWCRIGRLRKIHASVCTGPMRRRLAIVY